MPAISEEFGLLCPIKGCGGFAHNKPGEHNRYGKFEPWCRRTKICDKCGAEVETLERVVAVIKSLFPLDRDFEATESQNTPTCG